MKTNDPLELLLFTYGKQKSIPKPSYSKQEETVQYMKDRIQIETMRTNRKDFMIEQIGFIHIRTWILQISALMILYFLMIQSPRVLIPYQNYVWASIAAPIICILATEEIARVYHPGMLEIEMTTKYPLRLVMLSRFLILGVSDLFLILLFTLISFSTSRCELLQFSVYILVPFLFVSALLLCLMNYFAGEGLQYCMYGICVTAIALMLLNVKQIGGLYERENLSAWIALGTASVLLFIYAYVKMNRKVSTV